MKTVLIARRRAAISAAGVSLLALALAPGAAGAQAAPITNPAVPSIDPTPISGLPGAPGAGPAVGTVPPSVASGPRVSAGSAEQVPATGSVDRGDGLAENRYHLTLLTQTFDGVRERSHSQKAGFARLRKGDESWVKIDYGDGAMVIGRPARNPKERGQFGVANFRNDTPAEIALAYDYRTNLMRGNVETSAYHNHFVRPLLDQAPPLGQDASWSIDILPAALGIFDATGYHLPLRFKRHYFERDGQRLVLVEYEAPAFTYVDAFGETVVHWAKGVALADPDFGRIYWNASLHRATARQASGTARPYRYARSYYAMNAAGKPLMDLSAIPEMRPYLAEYYGKAATQPIPPVADPAPADQTPLRLAARMDIAAFSILENSANQMGEVTGSSARGQTGKNEPVASSTAISVAAGLQSAFETLTNADLNNYFIPGTGAATTVAAETLTSQGKAVQSALSTLSAAMSRLEDYESAAATAQQNASAALRTLVALDARKSALEIQMLQELATNVGAAKGALAAPATTVLTQLSQVSNEAKAAYATLASAARTRTEVAAILTTISNSIPKLQASVLAASGGKLTQAGANLARIVADSPLVSKALTGLGYAANTAAIGKTMYQGMTWSADPTSGAPLQGSYEGKMALIEPFAAMVAAGADLKSGNMIAVALDVVNFATSRFADIGNSAIAASITKDQQKLYDQEQQLIVARHMAQVIRDTSDKNDAAYAAAMKTDALLAQRQREIDFQIDALTVKEKPPQPKPQSVTDANWKDPRYDQKTGLPIPDYWAWLQKNDPGALVRLGIDPLAPVGTPPGTRVRQPEPEATVQKPVKPVVIAGDLDDGPKYPIAKPKPAKPKPGTPDGTVAEAPGDDDTVVPNRLPPDADLPRPIPVSLPLQHSIDDPVINRDGPASLDVTPLTFDPVTFDPVTFTPVTFEPVTWTPVTWEPPTWVPPTFEAPKPSEIPWTDFGDDGNWPHQAENLAFDYGDMSGQVATDLSPWAEWLKTQNIRELERMALAAGYPNLASALADSKNLLAHAHDTGFRQWAYDIPAFSGSIGLWASEAQHNLARAQLALGDLLAQSRDIFSSGGFSDIGISGFDLAYILRDYGIEDGDIIDISLQQFGRSIYSGRLSLLNAGTAFANKLRPGVAELKITAVNEGYAPPNTAEISLQNVVRGDATQTYSLNTGDTATLRIEANSKRSN